MKNKKILVIAQIGIIVAALFLLKALIHNDSKVISSPVFQIVYDRINFLLWSFYDTERVLLANGLDRIMPLQKKLSPSEIEKLRKGEYRFLSAGEVLSYDENDDNCEELKILVNTPADYEGKNKKEKMEYLTKVLEKADKIGIKIIIDSSVADIERLQNKAYTKTMETKNRVIRLVIFDGGHHLASLGLEPDLIILPVFSVKRGNYVCHGYLRDAIELKTILGILENCTDNTIAVCISRLSPSVKTKSTMGKVAVIALEKILKYHGENGYQEHNNVKSIGNGYVYMSNGIMLVSFIISGQIDMEDFANKIEGLVKNFSPREVYLSITAGDSIHQKDRFEESRIESILQGIGKEFGVGISLISIQYSARDFLTGN
jgi:hypothetical protein